MNHNEVSREKCLQQERLPPQHRDLSAASQNANLSLPLGVKEAIVKD